MMFNTKRIIATALTGLSLLANAFGSLPNSSCQVDAKSISVSKKPKNEFEMFLMQYPELVGAGVIVAATAGVTITKAIVERVCFRNLSTAVDNMSNAQVLQYRNEQMAKFMEIGKGTFQIDQAFIDELSPRITALIMAEINAIFEAYPNITHTFIKLHKYRNTTFHIGLGAEEINPNWTACASITDILFNQHRYRSLSEHLRTEKYKINIGFHSDADSNKLLEHTVAHEMGHLLENIVTSVMSPDDYIKYHHGNCNSESIIKQEIIGIARNKFNYKGNGHISNYGATSDREWFAETSAHYFCSEKPNALGLAFKEFLDQKEKAYESRNQSE